MADNFVHLHVHTEYSYLDGGNRIETLVDRAKELGMEYIAITDHNHVAGVPKFQAYCNEAGVKPILGAEMYYTEDRHQITLSKDERDQNALMEALKDPELADKINKIMKKSKAKKLPAKVKELIKEYEYDTTQYHIIILAINQTGWNNLVKLQSQAAKEGTFNGRFCADNELLRRYNEGLIMSTACVASFPAKRINEGKIKKAEDKIDEWHEIFGDRLYLEIQPIDLKQQITVNYWYYRWSKEKNIKLIATTDCHYTRKEDHDDHDSLLCVGMGKLKSDNDRMKYLNDYWLKSYDEMEEGFENQAQKMDDCFPVFDIDEYREATEQALENTNYIASLTQPIKLGSDKQLFPNIKLPNNVAPDKYMLVNTFRELFKYSNKHPEIDLMKYIKRLNRELKIIIQKGFAPYMCIVQEYIKWANGNGCPTGPGRGSAVGSLALFLMGVTKVDPIKYGLLFERFLTPDRKAPPDIDMDLEYYNRGKVIHHLEDEYGKENVCHIGTITELGVKNGLSDFGRILDVPFSDVKALTKKIDEWSDDPHLTFKKLDSLKDSEFDAEKEAWREFNSYEQRYPEMFRLARKFEGFPRNCGVHASGILVTPMPVTDMFPVRYNSEGVAITLFDGVQLESLNAIKFDLLGLKTISVIDKTLKSIDKTLTVDDLYQGLDKEETDIYEYINSGETDGIFQIESSLYKQLIKKISPSSYNEIIIMDSIGRPGPLSAKMDEHYANRKNGTEEETEPLKNTWDIVADTKGVIVYQEQVMRIAKVVAGFDDNQADSYLRKAMSKKKKALLDLCEQWFIYGKINQKPPEGYDENNKDQPFYDPEGKYGAEIKGGIRNGYDVEELKAFFKSIRGYADYLFNKSHACAYGFITIITAWLKLHYGDKYTAALLSVQTDNDDINKYIIMARRLGYKVLLPSINKSEADFIATDKGIRFGLSSIKNVGKATNYIIQNRPYMYMEDIFNKIPKKNMNKKVSESLIKAGAFDEFSANRYTLMNRFYNIRGIKEKECPRFNEAEYSKDICTYMEKEMLSVAITYVPAWEIIKINKKVVINVNLVDVRERQDKNGRLMAFIDADYNDTQIKCIAFSSLYCKKAALFDMNIIRKLELTGRKDDKGTFIISNAKAIVA